MTVDNSRRRVPAGARHMRPPGKQPVEPEHNGKRPALHSDTLDSGLRRNDE